MTRFSGPGVAALAMVLLQSCGGGHGLAPVGRDPHTAAPSAVTVHAVSAGETLYAIAWRYGLDYREIARHNGIFEPYTIFPGQDIRIPTGTALLRVREQLEADAAVQSPATPRPLPPAQQHQVRKLGEPSMAGPSQPGAVRRSPSATAPGATQTSPSAGPAESAPAQAPPKRRAKKVPSPALSATANKAWRWPTKGKVIGRFSKSGRKGVDIAGRLRQPVQAASVGKVVYAGGGLIGYGKLIIIMHDKRFLSAYAHNDRLLVKEGDAVKAGQRIADMGRSGTDRVKLHFEIRRDGKPVDPMRYLPR